LILIFKIIYKITEIIDVVAVGGRANSSYGFNNSRMNANATKIEFEYLKLRTKTVKATKLYLFIIYQNVSFCGICISFVD
jgi:hypothetical protein